MNSIGEESSISTKASTLIYIIKEESAIENPAHISIWAGHLEVWTPSAIPQFRIPTFLHLLFSE